MGPIWALSGSQITPRCNSALNDWHATLRQACGLSWLATSPMRTWTWGATLEQWQLHSLIMASGLSGTCIAPLRPRGHRPKVNVQGNLICVRPLGKTS